MTQNFPQYPPLGPPAPTPKKRRRWPWIVGAALVVIIIIVAVNTGGGADKSKTSAAPTTGAGTTAVAGGKKTTSAPDTYRIGQPVAIKDDGQEYTVTVSNLRKLQSDGSGIAKGQPWAIDAAISVTKGTVAYNAFYFQARGADGQTFDQTITTDGGLTAGELRPGGKIKGAVAFDVPDGQSISQIILTGTLFGDLATWNVS